ncbi:MAG: FimV/HubP family polar landmark protein [Mariprofundus sp.]
MKQSFLNSQCEARRCGCRVTGGIRIVAVGFLTLMLLCLSPAIVSALGFGALSVKSALNQPLQADVSLLLSAGESVDQVSVALASKAEYRQMGLPWHEDLTHIHLSRLQQQKGGARVHLSTSGPIHAPILSLLLKAGRAGRGTYFRQYRMLFDTVESAALPNQQPVVIPLRADSDEIAQTTMVAIDAWARASRYGPVRAGDNLSRIAQRLRKDKRFSNTQVMLALYDKNRRAFVSENINQLKMGGWLDVPEAGIVREYATAAVRQRMAQQLQLMAGPKRTARAAHPLRAKKSKQGMHYSANISLQSATGKQVVKPDSAPGRAHNDGLAAIHAELMAGKLQMTDLGASVSLLHKSVAEIQQDMQILKQDMVAIKNRPQVSAVAPVLNGKLLLYILLACLSGLLIGLKLRGRNAAEVTRAGHAKEQEYVVEQVAEYRTERAEPVEGADQREQQVQELTLDQPATVVVNHAQADAVTRLINKVEGRLSRCDYEEAARLLDEVKAITPDSLNAAALRAQLLHETGHIEQRNALINQISDSSDRKGWQNFCHYLPAHVWNACFGDGASLGESARRGNSDDMGRV